MTLKEEKKCDYCLLKKLHCGRQEKCKATICPTCQEDMKWSERCGLWYCKGCTTKRWASIVGKLTAHGIYKPENVDEDKKHFYR